MDEILATLTAVCDRHSDQVVGRWHLVRSDDRFLVLTDLPVHRQMVRGVNDETRVYDFATKADGPAENVEGQGKGHFREILTCPKPSCEYEAQLVLRPFRDRMRETLLSMHQAGIKSQVVQKIDTPQWKRLPA